jgi:tRNA dimethylallyltransferase
VSASPEAAAVIVVVGATGTGKSALSLGIAEALAAEGETAEIVNADAMQLYRGMDIGTAKLSLAERRGIRHHMLDVLDLADDNSVAEYQMNARAVIDEIVGRGHVPILVGGSGLYVSSVIFDFQFPGTDDVIRARLEAELIEVGPGMLYARLKQLDPAAATSIGARNGRRLVRALEVIELTGTAVSGTLPDVPVQWRPSVILALAVPREHLVARLDQRVEQMWRDGLIAEVSSLLESGLENGVTASRAIGYAQGLGQLRGTLTEAEAIASSQALTRRYARRQVGWFRRYTDAHWLEAEDADVLAQALLIIRSSGQVLGLKDGN